VNFRKVGLFFFAGVRFFSGVVAGAKFEVLLVFLRGVLGKLCVWMWFFDGENVVRCVVNVAF